MQTFTIAVPDEGIQSFEAFIAQSKTTIIDKKRDNFNIAVSLVEMESVFSSNQLDNNVMQQLERDLEEEIWKLHHFTE